MVLPQSLLLINLLNYCIHISMHLLPSLAQVKGHYTTRTYVRVKFSTPHVTDVQRTCPPIKQPTSPQGPSCTRHSTALIPSNLHGPRHAIAPLSVSPRIMTPLCFQQ